MKQSYIQTLCSLVAVLFIISCAELQQVAQQIPQGTVSENDIGLALREALENGVEKEVIRLTEDGGFYYNSDVKIGIPKELEPLETTLRKIGLESLTDEGIKLMNRAAEDAVSEALPIFREAIVGISFREARNILLGSDTAATSYLQSRTRQALYQKFQPVIANSFQKVGAQDAWKSLVDRYNALPLTREVNPDLTDHVTRQALDGVFLRIAEEEIEIRNSVGARSSALLRRVFALQDDTGL